MKITEKNGIHTIFSDKGAREGTIRKHRLGVMVKLDNKRLCKIVDTQEEAERFARSHVK